MIEENKYFRGGEKVKNRKLKSQTIPGAREKQAEVGRYYRRTLLNAIGLDTAEFEKPLVAVVNGWSEISPGHFHLRPVADAVKQGIIEAGGHPAEFGAAGLCDGLSVGSLRRPIQPSLSGCHRTVHRIDAGGKSV